ncbi:MAG: thioredoxin family protein [Verrucomicrobiota bacterium]
MKLFVFRSVLSLGIIFAGFSSQVLAAGLSSQWTENYQSAISVSQSSGKPILVYFGADWCGPCQHFKKIIGNDARFLSFANENLVLLHGDLTSQDSASQEMRALAQRMRVKGIPHIGLIDANGEIIVRKLGRGANAKDQIQIIQKNLDGHALKQQIYSLPVLGGIGVGILVLIGFLIFFVGGKKAEPVAEAASAPGTEFPSPELYQVLVMGQLMNFRLEAGNLCTDTMNFPLSGAQWLDEGTQLQLVTGTILEFKPIA